MLDQRDVERTPDLDRAERLFGGRRCGRGSPLLDLEREDALLGRVGGDDEHVHRLEGQQRGGHRSRQAFAEDGEAEGRARVRPRLHPSLLHAELTVHHLDQLLGRAQAQHGQPVAGFELVVGTGHAVETATKDPRRHAPTGVADVELQRHEAAAVFRRQLDADSTAIRAIDRTMQERQ